MAPGIAPPAAAPPPSALTGATVSVVAAEVFGVSAYKPGRFATILAPLSGAVDEARIEDARAAILSAYRADGFLFVAVKASVEANNRLVFTVTEGRIVEVKLEGDIGPAGVQVLRFLNHLIDNQPLDIATLERWLLLAQDMPGITLRTVLRPSTSDPGALSMVAQVSRKRFSGLLVADNRGYSGTGPEEFPGNFSANSFSEYGERTDLTMFYTARSTQVFGQAATEVFVGASGLKLRVYAGAGSSDPTGALGQIGYAGSTVVSGAQLSYPLIRRRQQSLTLLALFDTLNSTVDTGNTGTSNTGTSTLASRDSLRVIRLGADYALRDVTFGDDRVGVTTASLRVSQGLRALGASHQGDSLAGRLGERIDFTKSDLEVVHTQTLFSPWQDASFALQPSVSGQYSTDVLPSAEKFYLGGLRFNRGFYSGQVSGDRALTFDIEAQLNTSFSLPGPEGRFELGTQFYTFYDWGTAWQSQKIDANAKVVSAGLGVRTSFPKGVEVDLEGVKRVTRQPLGKNSKTGPLPGTGFYWRVIGRF